MTKKWDECTALILEKLKVQENRMQDIEVSYLSIRDFEKKFKGFQQKVADVIRNVENLKDIAPFCERTVPLLVHFQVSEAI